MKFSYILFPFIISYCVSFSIRRCPNCKFSLYTQNDFKVLEQISYVDALINEADDTRDSYFFPGHSSGSFLPKELRAFGSELFKYDLPELDGLDNIHCPEVRQNLIYVAIDLNCLGSIVNCIRTCCLCIWCIKNLVSCKWQVSISFKEQEIIQIIII